MVRHLLRDYVTQSFNTTTSTFIGSYISTIFMRRVLGYSYVGDTNYPINPVGTMLIATADSTPTAATPTFAVGTRAGINNNGAGKEFNVSIPSATRTVSSTDNGRILALKSTANPTYNSGCFLITGFDTGTNSYQVDFRSGTALSGATNVTTNITLPTGTITVGSTTGFPGSGTITVVTTGGTQTVNYTSTNSTQFLGCTGGTGNTSTGAVNASVSLPQSTLLVNSTTGFPSSGTLFVFSSAGRQTVTYTGVTATSFTGCSGGTGTVLGGITSGIGAGAAPFITTVSGTTVIASPSGGQSLPQSTITVNSTTTATTTIASGSNNTILPGSGTLNVASTTGFPTSGTIYVTTNLGIQLVTYTGTSGGNQFTGCTGGTGLLATGNAVYAGYAPTGIIFVTTAAGVQQVSYTGTTGTTFTGCSGGTGLMTNGNSVYYSPNVPLIEAADSMNWYLYEKDTITSALAQGTSNGNTTSQYRGNGTSTTPRIILQSPHPLGWQVRVCHETVNDSGVGNSPVSAECALITFAPGFGGNASGDFAVGGPHLHAPLFFNSNSNNLQGGAVGFGDSENIPSVNGNIFYRITIAGDTDGYGCSIFGRRPGDTTNPKSYWQAFGMCQIEATPLPPNNEARLYTIGSGNSQSNGNNLNDVSFYPGNIAGGTAQGVTVSSAFGAYATPTACNISMVSYATGSGFQGSPVFDGSAGDSPWFGGVEMLAVDIISGVFTTWNNSSFTNFGFPVVEGRFLGTLPHIREGRANYAEYSTTADLVGQHMRRGMWLLWGGPPVIT